MLAQPISAAAFTSQLNCHGQHRKLFNSLGELIGPIKSGAPYPSLEPLALLYSFFPCCLVSPPEYVLVTSPVGGELRFAAAVGSRLANLGALTQGDRNAIHVQNLASLDVGSKLGEIALKTLYNSLQGRIPFPVDVVPPPPIRFVKLKHILEYRSGSQGAPPEYNDAAGPGQSKGNKMKETRSTMGMWLSEVDLVEWKPWGTAVLEKHIADSARFFNRLLGLPLSIQRYFVK